MENICSRKLIPAEGQTSNPLFHSFIFRGSFGNENKEKHKSLHWHSLSLVDGHTRRDHWTLWFCREGELFGAALILSITSIVSGQALTVIAKHSSAITIRKLWKDTGLLLTRYGNYTTHLGTHGGVRGQGESWSGVQTCSSALIWVKGVGRR